MALTALDYLEAARVPPTLEPQELGLWTIRRVEAGGYMRLPIAKVGWPTYTCLHRWTEATLHRAIGECVMDDSMVELRQHLPIWVRGEGRILVTGLGLGCVVRGLLAKPAVEHIDVVEIDPHIFDVVGREFRGNPRVTVTLGDALKIDLPGRWDYAWHDIWTEGPDHLQVLHCRLIKRFVDRCGRQGAWKFPRKVRRAHPAFLL